MNEPLFHSAADVADMLRRKDISSRELTEMLLARIDAVNPALKAVVELRPAAALRQAAAADQAIAQRVVGPLHGVPMTIKESFNVAGLYRPGQSSVQGLRGGLGRDGGPAVDAPEHQPPPDGYTMDVLDVAVRTAVRYVEVPLPDELFSERPIARARVAPRSG